MTTDKCNANQKGNSVKDILRRLSNVSLAVGLGALTVALLGVSSAASAANPTGPNLLQNGGFEEPVIAAPGYKYFSYPTETLPGWDSANATVSTARTVSLDASTAAVFPAEGNQFYGLGGYTQNGLGQAISVPLEPGKTYQVSFYLAASPSEAPFNGVGLATAHVELRADGCQAEPFYHGGISIGNSDRCPYVDPTTDGTGNYHLSSTDWVLRSYTFKIRGTQPTNFHFLFTGTFGGRNALIDGVSLNEIFEIPAVMDAPIASAPVVLLGVTVAGAALAGVLAVLGWRRRAAVAAR